jgi:formate dehydrogenase major subunit
MGQKAEGAVSGQLSRRDFLKVAGAGAAALTAADFAVRPSRADAATVANTYHTTCPYCSASCGQMVDVDSGGNVIDIYGDYNSPFNNGGLCAKGAGSLQLANNKRRLGAFAGAHPVNAAFGYDSAYTDGIVYKRTGNSTTWEKLSLSAGLTQIAEKLVAARAIDTTGWVPGSDKYNSRSVAFFGSSHMNNEGNYIYRKIIANFGTQNTEHQARI